jgi:anti-sigma factor RsiW
MQWGTDNLHSDLAAQRERLSALLDGELDAEQRRALERHLVGCGECQRELAALREVRTLLRALPTPTPPRSFALPLDAPVPAAMPDEVARTHQEDVPPYAAAASASSLAPERQAARISARLRLMRTIGQIAAVMGLALLASSIILGAHTSQSQMSAASAGVSRAPVSNSNLPSTSAPANDGGGPTTQAGARPSTVTPTQAGGRTPAATTTQAGAQLPGATTTQAPYGATNNPTSGEPAVNASIPSPPTVPLAGAGLGLLGGGVILLVAGRRARRRGRAV